MLTTVYNDAWCSFIDFVFWQDVASLYCYCKSRPVQSSLTLSIHFICGCLLVADRVLGGELQHNYVLVRIYMRI